MSHEFLNEGIESKQGHSDCYDHPGDHQKGLERILRPIVTGECPGD
jgi:hypothetical protein